MGKETDKIYLLRHDSADLYVAFPIDKPYRVYTSFLEYAVWFKSKKSAEKCQIKESEWVDDGYKWWMESENAKYEKNCVSDG